MPRLLLTLLLVVPGLASARAEEPPPAEKPGLVKRVWQSIPMPKWGGKKEPAATWKDLRFDLVFAPPIAKLAETRRVEVTLQLTNGGKKLVQLDFPSSQRIDVVVKTAAGRVIERWSDDQAIEAEPGVVTINPGERVEYAAAISTREMAVGQRYTVEAFFPRYPELRALKTIAAE
jgi:Intracellular proteinase inhibitor